MAAFQPNADIMKAMSQFHFPATISTGGAANGVNVPPMETLTNSTPSVAYFKREEMPFPKKLSARIRAANVMAAGSVMNDPSKGTSDSTVK